MAKFTPRQGMIQITPLDEVAEAPGTFEAVVNAVGPKVSGVKKGSAVLCREYAREGVKFGDTLIISEWDVLGTIS